MNGRGNIRFLGCAARCREYTVLYRKRYTMPCNRRNFVGRSMMYDNFSNIFIFHDLAF